MVWYTFNSSIQEAETGRILYMRSAWSPGQKGKKNMSGVIVYASNFYTREAEAEEFKTNKLFSKTQSESVCVCNITHSSRNYTSITLSSPEESAHSPKREPCTSVL